LYAWVGLWVVLQAFGFAWDLLRVVVLGFYPLFFGFACISGLRFWGCFHVFWVGVSSEMYFVVWDFWEFLLVFGFLGALGFVRA
jgi:hypothetical protein